MASNLIDPVTGFRFIVAFDQKNKSSQKKADENYDASFQEVSGISVEMPTEDIQEGGENRFNHRLPQPIKYPNLVLKRGVMPYESSLSKWLTATFEAGFAKPIEPKNLVIILLGEMNQPLITWTIENAYPIKLEYTPLAANKNELLVETVELAYQFFKEERLIKIKQNKNSSTMTS